MKIKSEYFYNAVVERVVDGDSVFFVVDDGFYRGARHQEFRLTGPGRHQFDAPEWNTPEGEVASAWLRERLPAGTAVVLQTYKARWSDKYKRWLATVWLVTKADGDQDLATQMIGAGLATWVEPATGTGRPPS